MAMQAKQPFIRVTKLVVPVEIILIHSELQWQLMATVPLHTRSMVQLQADRLVDSGLRNFKLVRLLAELLQYLIFIQAEFILLVLGDSHSHSSCFRLLYV